MTLRRIKKSSSAGKETILMKRFIILFLLATCVLFLIGGNALASLIDIEEVILNFPEPIAMILVGSGLVCLSAIGRKKFIRK